MSGPLPRRQLVEGQYRSFRFHGLGQVEFDDAGACYQCCVVWSDSDEVELHVPGCERIEVPAGTPPPGQCYECGATPSEEAFARGVDYASGPCPNEGGCSRWRDPGAYEDYGSWLETPAPTQQQPAEAEIDPASLPF